MDLVCALAPAAPVATPLPKNENELEGKKKELDAGKNKASSDNVSVSAIKYIVATPIKQLPLPPPLLHPSAAGRRAMLREPQNTAKKQP